MLISLISSQQGVDIVHISINCCLKMFSMRGETISNAEDVRREQSDSLSLSGRTLQMSPKGNICPKSHKVGNPPAPPLLGYATEVLQGDTCATRTDL